MPNHRAALTTRQSGSSRTRYAPRSGAAVEVAESSLEFDRRHKGSLHARAGVSEYWILNLIDRVLEVYRDPAEDRTAAFGWRYAACETFGPGEVVPPLAAPGARIAVDDLLP